jgi:glycogen(starch) synthase
MKLALLSFEYPPETGFGGIGTYSWYQARALAKLGHDVHVFAGHTEPKSTHTEHDGVRVTRLHKQGWLSNSLESLRQRRAWWGQNRIQTAHAAYLMLRKAVEKESFDWVEFPECGADGAIVTQLLQIPSMVRFHSPARLIMNIYDTPRIDREVTAFVEQIGILGATVRTSCSAFLAREVAEKMNVPTPIHAIPNGIDLELFDQDEGIDVHAEFGIPKDGVKVFFANRMEERKGIHLVRDMVKAILTENRDVHFVFAGQDLFGYMDREILPFVKANGLQDRFHYLGKLHLAQVRAVLKKVDVFLIPSLWENCPYSCIEAMAARRAIVSSDCGGMPELIQDGVNGLLAKNDDSASFVERLRTVVADPGLRERLGSAARAEVEARLTDTKVAQRILDTYRAHEQQTAAKG